MSSEDEYTEEDLDALLENDSNMDESSMNMIDLDLLLARPSESQRRVEDELNRRDLIIRNQEDVDEQAETEVLEENAATERRHAEIPRQIGLYPPGLKYFTGEGFSVFTWDDLSLEKDLGYSGRDRLVQGGLPVSLVDKILSDRMSLVLHLTPEVPHNNLIASDKDYVVICDFLFFSLTVCPSRVVAKVLEKALFDLFKSYGYDWKLTNSHLFACWINFGASESAILKESFYKRYLHQNRETFVPEFPSFVQKRRANKVAVKEIGSSKLAKLDSIKATLHIISKIFSHSSRFSQNDREDRSNLVMASYLVITAAQDRQIIQDVFVAQSVKNIFHQLLDSLDATEAAVVDIVELLIFFMPGKLCPDTVNWNYDLLPRHFQPTTKQNGYNHPHNLLHCLHLMPHSSRGRKMRSLLAFMFLQKTLGVSEQDLPNNADMTDVQKVLDENVGLWRGLHGHHYAMRCLVGFLDAIFSGDASDIPRSSDNFKAVRFVNSHLSEYSKRLPSMDPLNLDPVVVKEITCELSNRWTLALQNSENVFNLREQLMREN